MNRPVTWRGPVATTVWTSARESRWFPALLVLLVALASGYLGAANRPLVVAVLAALALAFMMVAGIGRRMRGVFLASVVVALTGYAFIGRGFAHVGLPPLYVSEMLLGIGVVAVFSTPFRIRFRATEWLVIVFMVWGAVNTVPYIRPYGIDALRDAAFWGYALFTLAMSIFIVKRSQFDRAIAIYTAIVPVFLIWVLFYRVSQAVGFILPPVPIADVYFWTFKPGDMGVHLAGAGAFLLMGLYAQRRRDTLFSESLLWTVWLSAFVVIASFSRGGMLAAGAGVAMAAVLRPTKRLIPIVGIGTFVVTIALLLNPTVPLGGGGREVSMNQLVVNAVSIVSDTDDQRAEGTKEWRLEWWGDVVGYTFGGPYFLTGKGFGINLAVDDGFSVTEGLRSPHNGHVTALARMGVPGLAIWSTMHLVFAVLMLRGHLRARRRGDEFWAGIDGWLLVYWAAAMINGAFDVYLEGPQGAIWMWVMMGLGLSALRIQSAEWDEADAEAAGAPRPVRASFVR